jgi:hypothetical protein
MLRNFIYLFSKLHTQTDFYSLVYVIKCFILSTKLSHINTSNIMNVTVIDSRSKIVIPGNISVMNRTIIDIIGTLTVSTHKS